MRTKAWRKHRLMVQFVFAFSVITLLVIIAFIVIFFTVIRINTNLAEDVIQNAHKQILTHIDTLYRNIEDDAYSLAFSPTIQKFLKGRPSSVSIEQRTDLVSVFSGVSQMKSLAGIALFDLDGAYLFGVRNNIWYVDGLPEEYRNATTSQYVGVWTDGKVGSSIGTSYALIAPVWEVNTYSRLLGKRIGTIVFTLRVDELNSFVHNNSMYDGSKTVLADAQGNPFVYTDVQTRALYESGAFAEHRFPVLLTTVVEKSGWTLTSVLPGSVIVREMAPLIWLVIAAGLLLIVCLALFLLFLYRQILQPISQISRFMQQLPQATGPARLSPRADNELGDMIRVMNDMLNALDENKNALIKSETLYLSSKLAQTQMEIIAYRNQINPHFLYNTLDCIRGIALEHDVDAVADISQSLSTMFRYAIHGGRFASVQDELDYVREYATIVGHRFMDRIQIRLDADRETLQLLTIRLLLQPLVENAVFHGVEKRVGASMVDVRVRLKKGRLIFYVKDDGAGMDTPKLEELRESLAGTRRSDYDLPEARRAIGLTNIARRLYLHYKEEASIHIDSQLGEGTAVTVSMPIEKEKEHV